MKARLMSIDDYLATISEPDRSALRRVRSIVRKAHPRVTEGFYYHLPAFRLDGKAFVAFRASKTHCSLHVLSSSVFAPLQARLKGFVSGKGTLRFTAEKPIPAPLLKAVLRARAREIGAS